MVWQALTAAAGGTLDKSWFDELSDSPEQSAQLWNAFQSELRAARGLAGER